MRKSIFLLVFLAGSLVSGQAFAALPLDFVFPPKWVEASVESGQILLTKVSHDGSREVIWRGDNINIASLTLTGQHTVYQVFSGTQVANVIDGVRWEFFDHIGTPIFDDEWANMKPQLNKKYAYFAFRGGKAFFVVNGATVSGNFNATRTLERLGGGYFVAELTNVWDPTEDWRTHLFLNTRELGADFDNVEWGNMHYTLTSSGYVPEMLYIAKKWGKQAIVQETFDGKRTLGKWYDEIHHFDIAIEPLQHQDFSYLARLGKKYYLVTNDTPSPAYDSLVAMMPIAPQQYPIWLYSLGGKQYIKTYRKTYWPYTRVDSPVSFDRFDNPIITVTKNGKKYLIYNDREYPLGK